MVKGSKIMAHAKAQGKKPRPQSPKNFAAIGSALVDILLQESDAFIEKTGAAKGGMTLVDSQRIKYILSQSGKKYSVVPGGSACNTIIGIARLGGKARFIGRCGDDELGGIFERSLTQSGVDPVLQKSSTPTGRVLSIVTPDAQRSMFTFLGASSETAPSEVTPELFKGASLVHIEGYLLFNQQLIFAALKAAKGAGAQVSLDLASYTVVEAAKGILDEIVRDYVDILIANEDEARVFTGHTDESKALETLIKKAEVAVLKVGKRGSYIAKNGAVVRVERMGSGEALDTTGAGDLWASGFLYGLVNGFALEKCGELGSACGYEVCQVLGASIPPEGWARIKKFLPS
jgi:sugar/nucleoside kinase (ribokinase family)